MIWSGCEKIEVCSSLVVLLIDMQDGFCGEMQSPRRQKLVSAQKRILYQCAVKGAPLIVIEYEGCGETIEELSEPISKVRNKVRILKSTDNAFSGYSHDSILGKTLKSIKARTLLLMGVNMSGCVLDTAQSAVRFGYGVETSRNLITDALSTDWMMDWSWYKFTGVLRDIKNLSLVRYPSQQARLVG